MGMIAHGLGLNTTVWSCHAGQFNICILADKNCCLMAGSWSAIFARRSLNTSSCWSRNNSRRRQLRHHRRHPAPPDGRTVFARDRAAPLGRANR